MNQRSNKLELTWYNKDQALIPANEGKYGYTWVNPKDPRYCETHTLVVDGIVRGAPIPKAENNTYSERADVDPAEDNLLVLGESGDVLEALTRVPELSDKYVGKIKCVYIDPPFNTSQAFASYEDNLEHSIWLTMMRDRLIHLRKLLSNDGSIWVHLDRVENHRMRVLLDEIFGSSNFVTEVIWKKGSQVRNNTHKFSSDHDTIYVYRKSAEFRLNRLPPTEEMTARYGSPDGDPVLWQSIGSSAQHSVPKNQHPSVYGIQHPVTGSMLYPPSSSNWRYGQTTMLKILREWGNYETGEITEEERQRRWEIEGDHILLREDVKPLVIPNWSDKDAKQALDRYSAGKWPDIFFTTGGYGGLRVKGRMPEDFLSTPRTIWQDTDYNDTAKNEIKDLFPGTNPFSTPKPERLLERVIHIATNPGDIVLDIFAGSGTTAAVAQKMGRRWVTCELMKNTVERFTLPRLEKVVKGEDMGGISTSEGTRTDNTDEGLPEDITPDEAQKFTSLLNKVIKAEPDLKKSADIKRLKKLTKTKKTKDTINWRGGGGFTVARLSPSCFDYDPDLDLVTLTEEATGQALVDSVAANLGFYLTPDNRQFDGILGRQHLAVIEGVLNEAKVDDLMAHLPQGHTLVLAATIVNEGVRKHVRGFKNGSRVINIPLDIFTYTQAQEAR